jgi:hypothetical protein
MGAEPTFDITFDSVREWNGTITSLMAVLWLGRADDGRPIDSSLLDPRKPKEREKVAGRFGLKSGKDAGLILQRFEECWNEELFRRRQERQKEDESPLPTNPEPPSADELLKAMPRPAVDAAQAMLRSPTLMNAIERDIAELGVAGEGNLVKILYLVGVSRLLPHPGPLSTIVQGESSSGKSYVIDKVASVFPPETIIRTTQLTPQALAYMEPGSLVHKLLVVGERARRDDDESAEATRLLRELQSAGRISKQVTMKIKGELKTEAIQQEGPIAYIESTTLTRIFGEDANRSLLIQTDETGEQTQRILLTLAAAAAGKAKIGTEYIVEKHHALQRLLRPYTVLVPFAEAIASRLPSHPVELRRAFPQLLGIVRASALLHQYQRKIDGDGRLLATLDDYMLARDLILRSFSRLIGGSLPDPVRRFLEQLKAHYQPKKTFTAVEAWRKNGRKPSQSSIKGYCLALLDAGVLEIEEESRGNKPAVYRMTSNQPETGTGDELPVADELDE